MNKLATETDVLLAAMQGAAALLHDFEARRAGIVHESKARGELVTSADRALNVHLANALHVVFPGDAICAEEGCAWDDPAAARRWFIDPIDGTRSFVAGVPGYTIMAGLVVDGTPQLGAVYDPQTRATLVAEAGGGVMEVGKGLRRELRPVSAEALAWSPFSSIEAAGPMAVALGLREIRICESVGARAIAMARGEAAVFVSGPRSPKLWDSAAASVIVHELGGRYTDFDLRPLEYRTAEVTHPRGAIASLGLDHVEVVAIVRRILGEDRR